MFRLVEQASELDAGPAIRQADVARVLVVTVDDAVSACQGDIGGEHVTKRTRKTALRQVLRGDVPRDTLGA